ncbi:hypothetical protein LOAG_14627, partial [Loa loa]
VTDQEYQMIIGHSRLRRRQHLANNRRDWRSRSLTPSGSRSEHRFRTLSPVTYRHHIF